VINKVDETNVDGTWEEEEEEERDLINDLKT
jgi:hypothetical protein